MHLNLYGDLTADASRTMTTDLKRVFNTMLDGIGKGIGNTVAHEIGHQFCHIWTAIGLHTMENRRDPLALDLLLTMFYSNSMRRRRPLF